MICARKSSGASAAIQTFQTVHVCQLVDGCVREDGPDDDSGGVRESMGKPFVDKRP